MHTYIRNKEYVAGINVLPWHAIFYGVFILSLIFSRTFNSSSLIQKMVSDLQNYDTTDKNFSSRHWLQYFCADVLHFLIKVPSKHQFNTLC